MEHRPVVSNSFLCINLWVAGDFLAQYFEDQQERQKHKLKSRHGLGRLESSSKEVTGNDATNNDSFSLWHFTTERMDWTRTAKCAIFGAFFTGPILALWYPYMDRICIRYKIAARYGPWGAPVLKVAADEFLMDPPCLVAFFGYMNWWETGGSWESLQHKLSTQFWPSWMTSLAIWPGILLGTFRFLPVPAQAPVINVCCIVWDGFLSYRNTLSKEANIDDELSMA